jgi:hypothetical protein
MISKKRIIKVPAAESSDQGQDESLVSTDESLIKTEQDMDVIPEDDPFENPAYEPPVPGEGP